jgi:hypothetical protein
MAFEPYSDVILTRDIGERVPGMSARSSIVTSCQA